MEDADKICDVGDSVLFNSLLGYSGEAIGFDAVRRSQDSNGRWWRSPMHVDVNGNPTNYPGSRYSFSKDHTLGVLLYFVTTPDRETARAQAKAWLHYMQKQGRIWDKIRIGPPDIPEPMGLSIAKGLQKCADGLMADGCAIRETVTSVVEVWEKVRDCILHPGDCWEKVRKEVQEDIDREIGFLTHNVCPEASVATCTVSPGLWFLFHRVWRDSLGLAPSASMQFADSIFTDDSYDEFSAWEVDQDAPPQLAAVNGLIRAILGKPASVTLTAVYGKAPGNPFFQYLMHKYVNNNMHPTDQIRDNLLAIAPSVIEEYTRADGSKWFRNEDGSDNAGDQWAWERDNFREAVRDTMGWDCLFIGNLLAREFQIELDYYMLNVFPDLLRDRKRILNQSLARLAESYGQLQRTEAGLDEFVEKAVAVIQHPDVTSAELDQLNREIVQLHRNTCPLSLKRVFDDYGTARAAFESLLRLKEESRRKFQDAERLIEFGEIWVPQMAPYADTESQLRGVRARLEGKTACLKLLKLLAAIPLRIEHEKINGTNQSLREIADQIVTDLRQSAKDLEYARIKTELNWNSAKLAEPLRQSRLRLRYASATHLAEAIGDQFQAAFARITGETSLLGANDLDQIRHDAVQIIEREKLEWDSFVTEFGIKAIVTGRLQMLNTKAKQQFQAVQGYTEGHPRSLFFQWQLRSLESGYRLTQDCNNAGRDAFRLMSCWQFKGPSDFAPRDEWMLFDVVLDGLDGLVSDFSKLGIPTAIERPSAAESRTIVSTGVYFDVQAVGSCQSIQTTEGVRYVDCSSPSLMTFQAAPVSPTNGNGVLENLTFFNRVVIVANGESLYPSSITWKLNGRRGDQSLQIGGQVSVDIPVSYAGSTLELTNTNLDGSNVFLPGTRAEVLVNYVYPDVRSIKAYAAILGKYARFMARIYRDLAPGSAQVEVIASLDNGTELLDLLLDRDDVDAITRGQIEAAKVRMANGRASISQACNTGGPELCTAQIRMVRDSLTDSIEGTTRELISLRDFLATEIQRLEGVNDEIRQQLQAILDSLARPESIHGLHPFTNWFSAAGRNEISSDVETTFVRGQETLITAGNQSLFVDGLVRTEDKIKRTKVDGAIDYFEWLSWDKRSTDCGRADFETIISDLANRGKASGPLFTNNSCASDGERLIHTSCSISLTTCNRLASLVGSSGRRLRVRAILQYNIRPFWGEIWLPSYAGKWVSGYWLRGTKGQQGDAGPGADTGFHVIEHANRDWFPVEQSVIYDVDPARLAARGIGAFGFAFNLSGGEVQFNSLLCQILNPF